MPVETAARIDRPNKAKLQAIDLAPRIAEEMTETRHPVSTPGNQMTYRVSYEDAPTATSGSHEGVTRTEYFRTELAALNRARQLIEGGDHHAVAVHHGTDVALAGVLLHLKLGLQAVD